jgi:hypothetical protein
MPASQHDLPARRWSRSACPFPAMSDPSDLWKPAKVFEVVVDDKGTVVRTTEITVRKLQCKD